MSPEQFLTLAGIPVTTQIVRRLNEAVKSGDQFSQSKARVLAVIDTFYQQYGIKGYVNRFFDAEAAAQGIFFKAEVGNYNPEEVDVSEVLDELNSIPGVHAEECYTADQTYGVEITINR